MKIAIPREVTPGETRVAAVPDTVRLLIRRDAAVHVQTGAGQASFLPDERFADAGATLQEDLPTLWGEADVVCKVQPPTVDESHGPNELTMLKPGSVLVAHLWPGRDPQLASKLAEARVTAFSLDAVPRITRAQSMDVLSSMSTLAGYKAVLLAAGHLGKILPMMMTAAGTIRPATVLVIGAGVAGLQAIATARRLGAVVKAVDTRPAVAEQVQSLGAKFVPMEVSHEAPAEDAGGYAADLGEEFYAQEQEILAPHVADADAVITTALIPGRPAPILITEGMVDSMAPGSAIVDLAAIAGGNCTLSKLGETVRHNGVTILSPENLAAEIPLHASWMFAKNVASFLGEFMSEGKIEIDRENEVVAGALVCHEGQVVHPLARKALGLEES